MNRAALAGVFLSLLAGLWQIAPPNFSAGQNLSPNEERIESGETLSPTGTKIVYRIRLLPVTSFPNLPSPVAAELIRRQCMIPQSFEAKQPENVIHGAFRAPGSRDWAALCASQGVTSLLVFFSGQFESPVSLRTQPDDAWLGAEPGSSVFGSSWGISVRSVAELRAYPEFRRAAPIDHDAIDDARLERSTVVHYYDSGRWLALNHSDGSD
ncbi:MAG TPA: hypothetical protein VHZ25_13005 [Acidobacteriaceae bacterium]|jgi:hypothetical protein|nr:hypothetical protein [Acidobacteriaceae bacterium]